MSQDLVDFLNEAEEEYDWLIPGLLEKHDRVVLTGGEGKGKTTFLRQFGIQCAAGIHPFTLEDMEAVRVLLFDCENPKAMSRRKLRWLSTHAGSKLTPGRMSVEFKPGGIDLTSGADARWFADQIDTFLPGLVIAGPVYKMHSGGPKEEEPALDMQRVIDSLRERYGLAIMLEHHQPHAGDEGRIKRPIGTSGWLRWPEFGLHLSDTGRLTHWRGARDERAWPKKLTRGGVWPYTVEEAATHVALNLCEWASKNLKTGDKVSRQLLMEKTGNTQSKVDAFLAACKADGRTGVKQGRGGGTFWAGNSFAQTSIPGLDARVSEQATNEPVNSFVGNQVCMTPEQTSLGAAYDPSLYEDYEEIL